MDIKETALRFGTLIQNELIQIRADQMELGQDLTERINGVADRVKVLDTKVDMLDGRVGSLETKVDLLDGRVGSLETKVDNLTESVDKRFDAVDQRFETADRKFDTMQATQTEMLKILIDIQRQLGDKSSCN
ncbi:MAG TPA: hypothetical protein VKZ82_07205 [Nonomuraea sp.]|nr:hypothetical protein [Nonomuraea sp.]